MIPLFFSRRRRFRQDTRQVSRELTYVAIVTLLAFAAGLLAVGRGR